MKPSSLSCQIPQYRHLALIIFSYWAKAHHHPKDKRHLKDNSHYFHFLHRRHIKYKLSFAKRIMKIIFFWEFILLKDLWWKWETRNDFFSTVRKIWWILMAVKSHYFLSKVSGRHYCANIGNFWIFFVALLCLSLILIMYIHEFHFVYGRRSLSS